MQSRALQAKKEGYMVALRPSTADAENREARASTCTQRQWQIRKHQKDVIFMLTFFHAEIVRVGAFGSGGGWRSQLQRSA